MTTKKHDELEGFMMEPSSATSGNGNRAIPRMIQIEKGEVLAD